MQSSELDVILNLPRQWQTPLLEHKLNDNVKFCQRPVVGEAILFSHGINQSLGCQRSPVVEDWVLEQHVHPLAKLGQRDVEEQVFAKVVVHPSNSFSCS